MHTAKQGGDELTRRSPPWRRADPGSSRSSWLEAVLQARRELAASTETKRRTTREGRGRTSLVKVVEGGVGGVVPLEVGLAAAPVAVRADEERVAVLADDGEREDGEHDPSTARGGAS